jgi:hypothetical protein
MPRPRIGLAAFTRFLDETYRKTWSFETLDEVLRTTPSVMIWDDHEIRDGWGSQGDEHVFVDTYYAAAREAFLQHQFARGPRALTAELAAPHASLHQSFRLHGLPVFVLDQRSARDVRVPQVLGEEQWSAFSSCIAGRDPLQTPYNAIVSPQPLLYRLDNLVDLASDFDDEVRDDLHANWSSEANLPELERVLEQITIASRRGLRAFIISGDLHFSALLRASAKRDGEPEVIAYEIVVSGLAGPLDSGGWKHTVLRDGNLLEKPLSIGGSLFSTDLGVAEASPNFGALEIAGGEAVAHLFQSLPGGPVHYRIPLQWGAGADDLKAMARAGRRELQRP